MAGGNKETVAVLLAALLLASGCGSGDSSQQLLAKAQELHQKGDNKTAIIQLKNALQKDPENGEARYLLGTLLLDRGELDAAEKELRKALQLKQEPAKVLLPLGKALMAKGQFQQVLDQLDAVPGKGEASAPLLTLRGNALLALGRRDAAKTSFESAVKQDSSYAPAYLGLGRFAVSDKDFSEAIRLVDLALAKAPQDTDALLMKADLLRAQEKKNEAEAAYRKVMQVAPSNSAARLQLASLFIDDGKFDAARNEIANLRKAEPKNVSALYLQALIDFRQEKYQAARDALQELQKIAPNYGLMLSGAVAYSLKNYEQAEKDLGEFLKQNPGHAFAIRYLAATRLKLNQPGKALDALKPLLDKNVPDANIWALAGEAYLQTHEVAKATEFFEKASSINPHSASVKTELAVSKLVAGKTEQAIGELEEASALDAGKSRADVVLVAAYLSKKQFDKALAAAAAFEKKQPDNPIVYGLKGAAYLGKKDRANARKNFEQALAVQPKYFAATLSLAQMDLEDNNPEAARKRFLDVLAKDQGNQQAMLSLAMLSLRQKQEQDYVNWLEKAVKASASALRPRVLITQYYLQHQDAPKALTMAREAQASNPDSLEALDMLGVAQLANNQKDNALATYKKMTALAPKSPLSHFRLAQAQLALKDSVAATASLARALELKPDYAEAQTLLFSVHLATGKIAEALNLARQVQKASPQSPLGYVLEGDALQQQKQYKEAIKAYQVAFDKGKSGPLAIKLHAASSMAGDNKAAEAKINQYLKDNPRDVATRLYLAEYYLRTKQYKPAIQQYEVALQQDGANILALNNLAWLYQQENSPRALDYAEQAFKLKPDNPEIMDTLGWLLVERGQTDRGIKLLQQALTKVPDAGEMHWHLAYGYYRSGDRVHAKQELKRLLDSGRKFSEEAKARELLKQLGG